MTYNKDTYCPATWHGGFFTYDRQSVCCGYNTVKTTSIIEFYKSDLVKDLKKNIAAGTPPRKCDTQCFDLEKIGSKSHRQIYLETFALNDIEFEYDPNVDPTPQYLELRLSNLCNFKCRMCTPDWSSLIGKEAAQTPSLLKWYPSKDVSRNTHTVEFLDEIIKMIPDLRWVNFTGGEPMIIPEVVTLMDEIYNQGVSENIGLHFTTNGSVVNPRIVDRFKKHKHVQLTISLDGIEDVAEYIRHGTVWQKMLKNCQEYGELNLQLSNMDINFNVSLSAYAALTLDRTIDFICNFNKKYQCSSTDMNLVDGVLSPLNLTGLARQTAIESMQKASIIIDNHCKSNPDDSRKIKIVGNQINSMVNKMITTSAGKDDWRQFKRLTHELDSARGENFEKVFGFSLD